MSPVINWKPYKMPPAPITSWRGDRRRWEVCIGGCLLCLAKEGQREKGGGKPRQELAGWRAERRSQKSELGNLGNGFKKWPALSSRILKEGQEELCVTKSRGMAPLWHAGDFAHLHLGHMSKAVWRESWQSALWLLLEQAEIRTGAAAREFLVPILWETATRPFLTHLLFEGGQPFPSSLFLSSRATTAFYDKLEHCYSALRSDFYMAEYTTYHSGGLSLGSLDQVPSCGTWMESIDTMLILLSQLST